MEKELETVEEVIETTVPEEEIKEEQPKVEMTEEEAKIAAENVKKLMQLMDKYKSPKERQEEKLKKYEEEYEKLPDGHYKKKQLEGKIYNLKRKVKPTVVWDSSKGTYIKKNVHNEKTVEE